MRWRVVMRLMGIPIFRLGRRLGHETGRESNQATAYSGECLWKKGVTQQGYVPLTRAESNKYQHGRSLLISLSLRRHGLEMLEATQ
jgi:hypothetical protein